MKRMGCVRWWYKDIHLDDLTRLDNALTRAFLELEAETAAPPGQRQAVSDDAEVRGGLLKALNCILRVLQKHEEALCRDA